MALTLKFILKQHTPLIHFQENARDATIRATELKPKLDRFLTEQKLEGFEGSKQLLVGYSQSNESALKERWKKEGFRALDYTLRIQVEKLNTRKEILGRTIQVIDQQKQVKTVPTFFANLGDEYKDAPKYLVEADTSLTFTSLHPELLTLIPRWLDEFLWHHNFGTRQSKGWGGFTIEKSADCEYTPYVPQGFFHFSIPTQDWLKCFETINNFYRLLRSGLNGVKEDVNGVVTARMHYCKPVIYEYASFNHKTTPKTLVLQWEKKTIKQTVFATSMPDLAADIKTHSLSGVPDHPLTVTAANQHVIKDLLGFATAETWRFRGHDPAVTKKFPTTLEKTHVPTRRDSQGNLEEEIRRMKSPMFIKPVKEGVGFRVYFKFETIPDQIKGAIIKFVNGKNNHQIPVWTPPVNFFEDMIRFAANDIVWSTFFDANPKYNDPAKMEGETLKNEIIRIFSEIKTNLPIPTSND